jgi:SpoVK/Ycf46/Vps4 family AAA+-type ATPase
LITSLATDDNLSPAQITQAVRFANLCSTTSRNANESTLLMAIKASQSAMGRNLHLESNNTLSGQCNFSYLNLDSDITVDVIERALKRRPSATFCFHGVPGSGKTSLAHHLAAVIDRPLMIRRASDLLGKYVGESETNIAKMFRDADNDNAVLLLDEADSFLRSRRQAERSWEVTQVNELLQQMESFRGVFICTTNLLDDVDDAALRRFAFKLRFKPLTQTQRESLFAEVVYGNLTTSIEQPITHALQKLETLTPGDFATIRKQEDLIGERYTPDRFLQHLTRECALKPGCQSTTMGFLG